MEGIILFLKKNKIKKSSIIMSFIFVLFSIIVVFMLLKNGNELLSVFVPIILSEILPRIYIFSDAKLKESIEGEIKKNSFEVVFEDTIIVLFYIAYISTVISFYSLRFFDFVSEKVNSFIIAKDIQIEPILELKYMKALFWFLILTVSFGILLKSFAYFSKKIYK